MSKKIILLDKLCYIYIYIYVENVFRRVWHANISHYSYDIALGSIQYLCSLTKNVWKHDILI